MRKAANLPSSRIEKRIGLLCAVGCALVLLTARVHSQNASGLPQIGPTDIAGVVTSSKGPEAGVWVIAETKLLPTKFRKIVVTDDAGRYMLPDLPKVAYNVWVRGYGLVDSKPVEGTPGKVLNLTAVVAPDARSAAQVYPANYWYSLIQVPPKSEFPGTGPQGNGIEPTMKYQEQWVDQMKEGCQLCHQLGDQATRELPFFHDGFKSSTGAWTRRIESGQRGPIMVETISRFGAQRALAMYADWTDRIAHGEVPPQPPRPQGIERNLVLTMWEWAGPTGYVHDEVSTDKRNPTLNANGPVYGAMYGKDGISILNLAENDATMVHVPTRDQNVPSDFSPTMLQPSPVWGKDIVFDNPAGVHNPMMDQKGRIWVTSRIRKDEDEPAFCKKGSNNPYAKLYPLERSGRQLSFYDPKTRRMTQIDTCFTTHHLQFAEDKDNTLFVDSSTNGVGWVDTRVFDETGNAEKAQGWCPPVIDTNGDGKIGPFVGPNDPLDPTKDKRIGGSAYNLIPSSDGSVWYTLPGVPGAIVRLDRGNNPPYTCKSEIYEPPFNNAKAPGKMGYSPRGIDVDRQGVVWTALSGSSHLASFDRRKCKILNGPTATGQQCPEGWTLYPVPGPQMKGVTDEGSSDFHYGNWVDQHNTLGLGNDIPIANGTSSDSLLVLLPGGRWVILRVPYPMGFYTRGLDGRIDDPNGGWKGRGLWADYGTTTDWHIEGGKGTQSSIVHFQLRPDPLAR